MSATPPVINAATPVSSAPEPMTADEAMDILSAAVQHAVARIMAAEAADQDAKEADAPLSRVTSAPLGTPHSQAANERAS